MRVGFTGTQHGMTDAQAARLNTLLVLYDCTEFHHGDCIGADAQAHDIAQSLPASIVIHPPTDSSKRAFKDGGMLLPRLPYLERNHAIVDTTELLIATPHQSTEVLRSGTWATIRYARRIGSRCIVINLDGSLS